MPKLDLNLDAYRLVAECLFRIRHLLREELHATHGEGWDEACIPAEIHGYLTQRRAREASINWHLTDSCDLLDYAGFANIFEIIAANSELIGRFAGVAPDPNVLRIRFLELDTILNRIAYVRTVSETEMGFLVSFDERLRRLTAEPAEGRKPAKERPAPAPAPSEPEPPAKAASGSATRAKSADTAATKDKDRERDKAKAPAPPPAEEAPAKDAARPPQRDKAEAPIDGKAVEVALNEADEPALLSALYREITTLADGLWSQAAPGPPKVWEQVRESEWYREQFAKLGLKPVSDFYGLVDEARDRLLAGTSRSDLQEFLKERNFAQVLLALRELFKHHLTN